MDLQLQIAQPTDRKAVAALIHDSTNQWYQQHGLGKIFPAGPESCELFIEVYHKLDDGYHWIARDEQDMIRGSCFFHPRETHLGLGIMNVHPDHFGKGIASRLLSKADELAGDLPIRLLSSALNLDSYSLYRRAGFTPYAIYQDMVIPVPIEGTAFPRLTNGKIRDAQIEDLAAIMQLESELLGISRKRDIEYFLHNTRGIWRIAVWELNGRIEGYLASVAHPASRMLGPGCSYRYDVALDLVNWMLNHHHRGTTPVVLVPVESLELSQTLIKWGAKICELHLAQVKGYAQQPSGIIMPSFLPESG
ncbi:GNAT family N-acetyltransferase [Providencia manganoxydans]|uniref:GNAT family N-acetyltransferase n=1 Tax=Providencia manganoxydans TaxID=2923283 RepID=UPI0034E3AFFE